MRILRVLLLVAMGCVLSSTCAMAQTWDWATQPVGLAGTHFLPNAVTSVAIDDFDNSYVVGQFNDSATFGPFFMKSDYVLDMFIAKLNALGVPQWVKTIGGTAEDDESIDVTVDPNGNVYMAGFFGDSADFDGTIVRPGTFSSVAIAKYNSNGVLQWAKTAAGLTIGTKGGIVYSPTGHIYLACGNTLAKYTLSGDTVWTRTVPLAFNTFSYNDAAVNSTGQYVYVTGQFGDTVDVGGITLASTNFSDLDIVVAKFDSDGNAIWAKRAGSGDIGTIEQGNGIAVDENDNAYVCGQYSGTAVFDADTVTVNSAYFSMFVAKYAGNGAVDWVLGGSGAAGSYASASDVRLVSNESAVLVAGSFGFPLTLGSKNFDFHSGSDVLLTKISADGACLWGQQSGDATAIFSTMGMDVNSHTSKAVVVGNYTSIPVSFGADTLADPAFTSGDGFIAEMSTDSPTPVEEQSIASLPSRVTLDQNYPNPFNPTTTIDYELPVRSHVEISIYNMLGERVRTLVNDDEAAGTHAVEWNGRSDSGSEVATGVYLYRIQAGDTNESKKMVLLK